MKKEKTITEKVTSYAAACKLIGRDPKKLPEFKNLSKEESDYFMAEHTLIVITEALNEGWKPDWSSSDYKYSVWKGIDADAKRPNGFGFYFATYRCNDSSSSISSRLLYRSSELALYSGKKFEKLWMTYMLYK